MSGPHSRDYYQLLVEQATQVLAMTDDIAQRARNLGGTTIRSITDISRHRRLKDLGICRGRRHGLGCGDVLDVLGLPCQCDLGGAQDSVPVPLDPLGYHGRIVTVISFNETGMARLGPVTQRILNLSRRRQDIYANLGEGLCVDTSV
jgi:hypothetical protein